MIISSDCALKTLTKRFLNLQKLNIGSKHEIPIDVIECEGAGSKRPKKIREITNKLE